MRTAGGEGFGDRETRGPRSDGCHGLTAGQKGLVASRDSRAGGGIWMTARQPQATCTPCCQRRTHPTPVFLQCPAPPARQPRPSWPQQGCEHAGGTTRAQTPSPGQGFAQQAPPGCLVQRGPVTVHSHSRRWSQHPGRGGWWPSPRPRWPLALPAPRLPGTSGTGHTSGRTEPGAEAFPF